MRTPWKPIGAPGVSRPRCIRISGPPKSSQCGSSKQTPEASGHGRHPGQLHDVPPPTASASRLNAQTSQKSARSETLWQPRGTAHQSCRCVIVASSFGTKLDGVSYRAGRHGPVSLQDRGDRSRRRDHQAVDFVRHEDGSAGTKKPDAAHQGWSAPGSRLFCEDGEGATVSARVTL